jgi:hypothetical protein
MKDKAVRMSRRSEAKDALLEHDAVSATGPSPRYAAPRLRRLRMTGRATSLAPAPGNWATRYRQPATGNWTLATGNRQLATGYRQLAAGYRLPATGNWLPAPGNWQLATGSRQLAPGNRQLATGNYES